jgi:hypothetical protein
VNNLDPTLRIRDDVQVVGLPLPAPGPLGHCIRGWCRGRSRVARRPDHREVEVLYVVAGLDLAVARWLLWYARRRERRNRAGVVAVGLMLVLCAVALMVIHATRPSPRQFRPVPPGETVGTIGEPA